MSLRILPGISVGKESACNVGDLDSIPGSGRSPEEGIGYPLQDSWASLGGSDGKESACNVGDLGWEDPLEKGMATHSSILAWGIPMDRGTWWATVHRITELDTAEHPSTALPFLGFPDGHLMQRADSLEKDSDAGKD